MGLFNVVAPCVVNGLHYVHPTTQPIEVDDESAAELLATGALEPYPPGVYRAPSLEVGVVEPDHLEAETEAGAETPKRTRRSRTED